MSIVISPSDIVMTKDFEQHFCKSKVDNTLDNDFGEKVDRQLVDVYGSYRMFFIDTCFGLANELVEDYPTGFWYVAELKQANSFFIFPAGRGVKSFRFNAIDSKGEINKRYDLDEKTLGMLVSLLAFDKCKQYAIEAQKGADLVASKGGEATYHDEVAAKIFHAKRAELLTMLVSTTEELAGTATQTDALANIALREFILGFAD